MNRKPRKLAIFAACVIATGLAACADNGTGDTAKTKNSALEATLVNGEFAPTGGGWIGDGFTLDRGCAVNNPVAARPSLGGWTAASLTFGRSAATVRQEVVVPEPTAVTFAITGNINANDPNGWFKIDLNDADEKKTTDRQTGTANIEPKAFTLSVTTTSPNEKVQIVLSGSGRKFWMGCYGPVLTKPLLTGLGISTPTTTTTVAETTTTSSTTTSTTSTTTTTTLRPTTTTTVPGCQLSHQGQTLTFCKPATNVTYSLMDATGKVLGAINSVGLLNSTSWAVGGVSTQPTATQIRVSLTFTDKSKVLEAMLRLDSSATVPFAPPPKMMLSVKWPTIGFSYIVQSYTYEWWDDTKALTQPKREYVGSTFYELSFGGLTPVEGATRLILSFNFTNGASVKGVTIPFPPSTTWSWPYYDIINSPY